MRCRYVDTKRFEPPVCTTPLRGLFSPEDQKTDNKHFVKNTSYSFEGDEVGDFFRSRTWPRDLLVRRIARFVERGPVDRCAISGGLYIQWWKRKVAPVSRNTGVRILWSTMERLKKHKQGYARTSLLPLLSALPAGGCPRRRFGGRAGDRPEGGRGRSPAVAGARLVVRRPGQNQRAPLRPSAGGPCRGISLIRGVLFAVVLFRIVFRLRVAKVVCPAVDRC